MLSPAVLRRKTAVEALQPIRPLLPWDREAFMLRKNLAGSTPESDGRAQMKRFREAAERMAAWLSQLKDARRLIQDLISPAAAAWSQRPIGSSDADAVVEQVKQAVDVISGLDGLFREYTAYLNPSIGQSIGLVMNTGAAERLGISPAAAGGWKLDEMKLGISIEERPELTERDMKGAEGWATGVSRLLDRLGQSPVQSLLSPALRSPETYSYTSGGSSIYTNPQPPAAGWLLDSLV
ncbi:hypothetical protein BG53_10365 [Paenibacillus darwinianus]|uniref:Uncharacterized protein n=1 Tax=Paenibacillus darwinianus TaxID=1380763 RepID=A0A9W5RYQ4_9BACL|nr:hypothetical protein [Paenibacillus darwinianus]EXX84810.1 hypothetical protein BG53_10365 [Paenibacillus darwinianus]EXX87054.1 hypothetical protein BG52_05055 [Paenibacillus darwinianus]EXX88919.1 hypothetical protein CH50_02550 [Paenibacillus darwinianus]